MAIYKKATFSHKCKVTALNKPKGWDIYDLPNQIKTASVTVEGEDLNGFDLKQATKDHPDHLYVKVFAIKKDEPNDNGDAFSEKELKTAAPTFVGVPLFTNHQNDDVEKARGECVHSWYDDKEGGIYIVGRVDKIAYPRLARGIEEGYITGTSMGCSVESSICSVCHNKAHTAEDYCSHVSNRKNRKYNGDIKCSYHNSPVEKEDKCPICSSTKNDIKTLKHSEQMIYEHNYGLKFIENSFVVNPACHDCGVRCVLHAPTVNSKVASFNQAIGKVLKEAHLKEEDDVFVVKMGGIQELQSLKNSMDELEKVTKSMLKQKENVSMEYVSQIVKAMADIQEFYDELTEMGYGALPSPPVTGEDDGPPIVAEQFPAPLSPEQMGANQVPDTPSGSQTSDMGGLGNVTMPKNSSRKIEDFSEINTKLINKVSSLEESLRALYKNINSQIERGSKMANDKNTKIAASADNQEVITEKQLDKKEETLHPRTESVYEGITESKEQVGGSEQSNDTTSDSPQVRIGTYETITEDQLATESSLGEAVTHFGDYPDVITEKQWNDFSRDVAGKLSDDYTETITQAQIRDLLSSHKFLGDIETITEDQLRNISMTDGLKRWASKDYSVSLVKSASNAIADMISTYRESPDEIGHTVRYLNDSPEEKTKVAFLSVLNSLPYKKAERDLYAKNASYFSKKASKKVTSHMDALIFSLASNGQFGQKAEDLIDAISHVLNSETQMVKVNSIVSSKMNKMSSSKGLSKESSFESAIKELDKPLDGKYRIKATLDDVGAPMSDKVAFVKGVKKLAQEMIDDESVAAAVIKIEVGGNGELIIDIEDGAEEEIIPDDIGDMIEGPIEDIDADINGEECPEECPIEDAGEGSIFEEEDEEEDSKDARMGEQSPMAGAGVMADAKKEIKKTAQMMGGEMGGMGGAAQAPGAGAAMPGAPEVGAPPMESFTEEPGFEGDEDAGLEDNLEPLPPGSTCPVCGSDDVDILDGKGKCNNCSSEMSFKVEINVTKWQGVTPDEDSAEEEEGFEGEGFEVPSGEEDLAGLGGAPGGMEQEMGEIPAAASVDNWKTKKFAATIRIKPEAVKKVVDANLKVGSISPSTGSSNTVDLGDGNHICLDTGTKYKVAFMASKDGKQVFGQWEWQPRVAGTICPSCDRAKQKFVKALSSIDLTEEKFDSLDLKEQVKTIVNLKKAGSLRTIKTASKEGSVVEDYKLAYGGYGDSFPVASCVEKLARRFGENAVCMSGPDEGKPLAESVCNRLKKADIYTSKIAIKVAENWSDCDGDEECITHQIRSGYSLRQAAEVCSALKIAVAEGEDFLADELSGGEESFDESPEEIDVMEEPMEEVDPFEEADDMGEDFGEGGTVTLELPIDIVEQLDAELDVALGENPAEEDHHEDLDMNGEADIVEEAPVVDEFGGDVVEEPIEEIGPGELDEVKPAEPAMGGEMKPATDGVAEFEENVENNRGNLGDNSNVIVNDHTKDTFAMENNIGKVGKTQMDLSGVIDTLSKMAGEKEISQSKAQDSKDIGSYTAGEGGSLMGHESETIKTPQKPSVPRDNATMGQEDADLNPQDKPQPVIPSENATMGHEDEAGLSGGDNSYTGGDKGQGKTELASVDESLYHMKGFGSAKDGISSLAERLAKKLAPKEPVADDADIKPISDGGTIGKEEKFDAEEINESEVKSDSGMIGHEKETLESKPDSPKDHPEVNTGNAQMGQEELDSEKTNKDKGTVIATNDSESEAIRVAGRMLQANKIEVLDLTTKINELKAYKPEQIKDIEKAIFASKGFDTVSDGMSQAVQINEASSVRNSNDELSSKLTSLFTLGRQNQVADSDDLSQLRKTYNK